MKFLAQYSLLEDHVEAYGDTLEIALKNLQGEVRDISDWEYSVNIKNVKWFKYCRIKVEQRTMFVKQNVLVEISE